MTIFLSLSFFMFVLFLNDINNNINILMHNTSYYSEYFNWIYSIKNKLRTSKKLNYLFIISFWWALFFQEHFFGGHFSVIFVVLTAVVAYPHNSTVINSTRTAKLRIVSRIFSGVSITCNIYVIMLLLKVVVSSSIHQTFLC